MKTKVTIYDRVLRLLRAEERYRNSDMKLFLRILDDLGCIVWSSKAQNHFIPVDKLISAPRWESVRRSRQHVQAQYSELQATDPKVRKERGQKEATKGTFPFVESYNPSHDGLRI